MDYFDFHAHIVLKQVFADQPNIDTIIYPTDIALIPALCTDLPTIIESQIHQSQLASFQDVVIVGAVLYGLESSLANAVIPLQKYLNLLSKTAFDSPLPINKVNIFFSVEGCHSLVDTINRVTPAQGYDPKEILSNLDILLGKVKIVAVNLTHLQQSSLCNHAFGMQLADPSPFYPTGNGLADDGRVVLQGLFDRGVGYDLKHMSWKTRQDLQTDIGAGKFSNVSLPMCTHAGFTGVAFKDWAGYISRKDPQFAGAPGVLYLEIAKTIQEDSDPSRPAPGFNMSTINLFNDDIEWIVRNGGMIGLSMDRRILGYVGVHDDHPTGIDQDSTLVVDREYFSEAEWAAFGIADNQIGMAVSEDSCVQLSDVVNGAGGRLRQMDGPAGCAGVRRGSFL